MSLGRSYTTGQVFPFPLNMPKEVVTLKVKVGGGCAAHLAYLAHEISIPWSAVPVDDGFRNGSHVS